MDELTPLDTTFLELEELDPGALMSIGGVMVFDPPRGGGPPDVAAVRSVLAARLTELPRYTQRLSSPRTSRVSWLHWVPDERFEIANHVRREALPPPGGDREICDWVAEFFSHPLDRTRPLWELVLLEGLEHGRWAVGWKTHHCLVDGVGSVGAVGLMLEGAGGEREATAVPQRGSTRPAGAMAQVTRAGSHAVSGGMHAALHPGETLQRSRELAELLVRDELVGAPHTSLNVPIGTARRYEIVRTSLADLKAAGRPLGASVNDVLLTACAGGLRALLLERGEAIPAQGLRAMVPINLRDRAGGLALGNRVSSLFVDLPVEDPAIRGRLVQIVDATRRAKASGTAQGATMLFDLAGLGPPQLLHAVLAQTVFSTRLFNLTITNVPGWRQPVHAFGARLREVLPVVPLAAEHAVGIAIFSYAGQVTVGISADRTVVPDIGTLAAGIDAALDELRALAA